MATDYYAVLGLSRGATDNDIKRAYRRLARDLHPDVNPDAEAKERFQEVNRAYQALTDPEKRRIVDLGGDPFDTGGGGGGGGSPFGARFGGPRRLNGPLFSRARGVGRRGGSPFGAGFGGLGDIMDAFFGGAGTSARGPRSRVRAGGDALIRVE